MRNRLLILLLITIPSVVLDQWSKFAATDWALEKARELKVNLTNATGEPLTGLDKALVLHNHPGIYTSYLNGFFDLDYAINLGAWGGLGGLLDEPLRTILLTYVVGAFLVGLAFYIVKQKESTWMTVALSFILAGGIGNFIDRAAYGYVVDFMVMGFKHPLRTNIFNIADVAIMIGAGILLVYFIKETLAENKAKKMKLQTAPAVETEQTTDADTDEAGSKR